MLEKEQKNKAIYYEMALYQWQGQKDLVSPAGSVGASALRAEVSTGDPHPLQGRQKVNLISLDEARFSNFIDSLKAAKYT